MSGAGTSATTSLTAACAGSAKSTSRVRKHKKREASCLPRVIIYRISSLAALIHSPAGKLIKNVAVAVFFDKSFDVKIGYNGINDGEGAKIDKRK